MSQIKKNKSNQKGNSSIKKNDQVKYLKYLESVKNIDSNQAELEM